MAWPDGLDINLFWMSTDVACSASSTATLQGFTRLSQRRQHGNVTIKKNIVIKHTWLDELTSSENWTYRYEVTVILCADAHHDYFNNRGLKTEIYVFTSQNKSTMKEQNKSRTFIRINCLLFLWGSCVAHWLFWPQCSFWLQVVQCTQKEKICRKWRKWRLTHIMCDHMSTVRNCLLFKKTKYFCITSNSKFLCNRNLLNFRSSVFCMKCMEPWRWHGCLFVFFISWVRLTIIKLEIVSCAYEIITRSHKLVSKMQWHFGSNDWMKWTLCC